MCTRVIKMNMELKNSEFKVLKVEEADLSTDVLQHSDSLFPRIQVHCVQLYSCTRCSLHKGMGSELMGAEVQARFHFLSMGLEDCLPRRVLSPISHKCAI